MNRLPPHCRIKSPPGSSRLIIAYGAHTLGLKFTSAFPLLILGSASAGIFLFIGISGWNYLWEPDLKRKLIVAGTLLIGTLVALFFIRQMIWGLFGMTYLSASRDSLQIQKRLWFLSFNSEIQRSDITVFQFGSHGVKNSEGGQKGYKLVAKGKTEHDVIPKENSGQSASWVGERLANWFEIPLIRKPFPIGRVRKR